MDPIVIVGGGIAGFRALRRIHERAPEREVILISDEASEACERPMLSKELLHSASGLRATPAPVADRVKVAAPARAASIDREARRVILADGTAIPYDKLILATGSRPRPLTGLSGSARVHYLRTAEDAEALRPMLQPGRRIVIIGGGFIGLEVACAARRQEAEVTVIELSPTLLSRTAPPSLASHLRALHEAHGARIVTGTQVIGVTQNDLGVTEVETTAGRFPADCVVVGIGILPNVEIAQDCGLAVANGITVDGRCRTSDPHIFAAGEVTSYLVPDLGLHTRSESWTVAFSQGDIAGEAAAGLEGADYRDLPWLWTDQYDTNVQYLGLPMASRSLHRVPGKLEGGWVEIGLDAQNRLIGAIGVNANREIAELRRGAARGLPVPERYLQPFEA